MREILSIGQINNAFLDSVLFLLSRNRESVTLLINIFLVSTSVSLTKLGSFMVGNRSKNSKSQLKGTLSSAIASRAVYFNTSTGLCPL